MHLDEIQLLNYKPCRGGVSPPSIVFHPTENRYNIIKYKGDKPLLILTNLYKKKNSMRFITARVAYISGLKTLSFTLTGYLYKYCNPHSAPPGVTIGNFGFLNTLKDNFYTKMSKF